MPEFTQVDYQNLAAIVSLAKFEGVQQAAALLVLHDKLLKAAADVPIAAPYQRPDIVLEKE